MTNISFCDIHSDDYKNHQVFEEIKYMMKFYDSISLDSLYYVPVGTRSTFNYAPTIYSSLEGTLDSIQMSLKSGRITDANTLIRKLFDDMLVEVYIEITRKDNYDWENGLYVEDVEKWLYEKHRIPKLNRLLSIIKNSESTKGLYPFFGWDTYLKDEREMLDDNVHANMFKSMIFNCSYTSIDRKSSLDNIYSLLKQFFTIHLSFTFLLNGPYMMASDYRDSIDVGEIPVKGSEAWIAQYAQDAFDKFIKPDAKLSAYIKANCYLTIN